MIVRNGTELVGFIFAGPVMLVLGAAFMSLPVMLLWDWLMPTLFGLREITWFQAWGLMVLSGLLFKARHKSKE